MIELTEKEFSNKYGSIPVIFSRYYKYTFTFTGTTPEGLRLVYYVMCDSDETYRMEVYANRPEYFFNLSPKRCEVYKKHDIIEFFVQS